MNEREQHFRVLRGERFLRTRNGAGLKCSTATIPEPGQDLPLEWPAGRKLRIAGVQIDKATFAALLLRSAVTLLNRLSTAQRIGLALAAIFYVTAGSLHFIRPEFYLKMMPPYIPWHVTMVLVSGFFEILGGLGLLIPRTRRAAAWGLVALLIAVFPANLYMATNPIEAGAASVSPAFRWGRLPLQLLLIWWVLWCAPASTNAPVKRATF